MNQIAPSHSRRIFCGLAITLLSFTLGQSFARAEAPAYNRDIRPVLSDNCFACHGPDRNTRKAKLRLDIRAEAVERGAIVPGKPDESELVKRIFTTDQDDVMPPSDSHKKLTEQQKQILKEWIASGAEYQGHWAYIPPSRPTISEGRNAIDFLVQERLKSVGLKPSRQADPRTLIRRLYFDLVGIPPRPEEVEAFEKDPSTEAYLAVADRLLASPHYGERMAIGWLDVVRFADTIGYHSDNPRNIWPYRDYVIRAFNENKPFDQFTREQLAGDLLPDATQETRVASAFNRLILSTEEGGAQPRDYEVRMMTDRVRAIGTIWLGQTIGCAQCHDHKFDPITQKDFYAMGAFFADIQEPIIGRREDGMLVPGKEQQAELARLEKAARKVEEDLNAGHPELEEAFLKWKGGQLDAIAMESFWTALSPSTAESAGGATLETRADGSVFAKGKNPKKDTYHLEYSHVAKGIQALRIEALPDDALPSKGPGRAGNGNFVLSEVVAKVKKADGSGKEIRFKNARASVEQTFAAENHVDKIWSARSVFAGSLDNYEKKEGRYSGWAVLPGVGRAQHLVAEFSEPLDLNPGEVLSLEMKQQHDAANHTLGHFRISVTQSRQAANAPVRPLPGVEIRELLVFGEPANQGKDSKLHAIFREEAPELEPLRQKLAGAKKAKTDFEASLPRCIVSVSSDQPRVVRFLPRGNWMIEDGEIMKAALPGYLASGKSNDHPLTRLDLANWLVSRDNPLTARVTMNRLWKEFFGMGLSKVLDDLGAQGEPPANQKLLDYLACEFMDNGWDIKHMVREIVTSATYKQSSATTLEQREKDPFNRELARQSRWRLDAELVRDNALSIAGLLQLKIGGPSVKPYQPDGYWENLNFPPRNYDASTGSDQYRRGLYTWWQRSYLHPSFVAFDAPTREECAAERNRSNIPQQALVLLNDPSYVEASRSFAARILLECHGDAKSRLNWAWMQALNRAPRPEELAKISGLLDKNLRLYKADVEAARKLLGVGQASNPPELDPAELAAWTQAARVILNLHETITRS